MKTRTDHVSNSSSCSFVVERDAGAALKTLLSDFGDSILSEFGTKASFLPRIGVRWRGWKESAEAGAWYGSDLTQTREWIQTGRKSMSDVDSLLFECDDWETVQTMHLYLLWLYFSRLGFAPDDSSSENPIRENFDEAVDLFMGKWVKRLGQQAQNPEGKTPDEGQN